MPVFLIICFAIIFALLLINLQLSVTVELDFDILRNDGYAAVYLFGISIIKLKIKFDRFDLKEKRVSISVNGRTLSFDIMPKNKDGSDNKDSIFKYLTIPILAIIDLIYFDMHFEFGYKKDALLTVMAAAAARMAFQIITSVLKSQQELLVEEEFIPRFDKDVLKIYFSGIISGSAANIIYSVVHALNLKKDKRERQSRKRLKGVNA